jgi:hypothetical protein
MRGHFCGYNQPLFLAAQQCRRLSVFWSLAKDVSLEHGFFYGFCDARKVAITQKKQFICLHRWLRNWVRLVARIANAFTTEWQFKSMRRVALILSTRATSRQILHGW